MAPTSAPSIDINEGNSRAAFLNHADYDVGFPYLINGINGQERHSPFPVSIEARSSIMNLHKRDTSIRECIPNLDMLEFPTSRLHALPYSPVNSQNPQGLTRSNRSFDILGPMEPRDLRPLIPVLNCQSQDDESMQRSRRLLISVQWSLDTDIISSETRGSFAENEHMAGMHEQLKEARNYNFHVCPYDLEDEGWVMA